jgi:predicted AlkP superfamily pyrophosphatase or phosphodiesterase
MATQPGNPLLVVQVAALGWDLVERHRASFAPLALEFAPLAPVFPALTCTAQATLRTARPPAQHGIVANGLFDRATCRTAFWEQSAALLPHGRIWDDARARGLRVGVLFWQQSLGEAADLVLSPTPIHKHEGGMIQDCYAQPPGLYSEVCAALGRPFNLMHYWGPLASRKATRWIVDATLAVLARADAPGLLLTYLPHLDYALQKHGPDDAPRAARAAAELAAELGRLLAGARAAGRDVVVFGDYAIEPARQVVFPNRALRAAGLFAVRQVRRMAYPDLYTSRAFALCDHQVAHVYVRSPQDHAAVQALLAALPGVERVLPRRDLLEHPRAGELVAVAAPGAWFAYPWWSARREAPDYATHVDIHSKPGYDPCELFWGWPPPSVSLDPTRVRGTHGRADLPAAWAATAGALAPGGAAGVANLPDLAAALRARLA